MTKIKNILKITLNDAQILNLDVNDINRHSELNERKRNAIRDCAQKLLSLIGEDLECSKNEEFKSAGLVNVASGTLWIGDGKNIIIDRLHQRHEDLGYQWSDVLNTFRNRSKLDIYESEKIEWIKRQDDFIYKHPDWIKAYEESTEDLTSTIEGSSSNKKIKNVIRTLEAEFEKNNPFQTVNLPDGHAQFNFENNRPGLGVVIEAPDENANYPVYISHKNGKVAKILVEFRDDTKVE